MTIGTLAVVTLAPESPETRTRPVDAPTTAGAVSRSAAIGALVMLGVALVVVNRWGEALLADGLRMKVHTPPLRGPTDWHAGWTAVPAVAVAALVVLAAPRLIAGLRWRSVLLVSAAAAVAWAVALAWIDGPDALTGPLHHEGQYLNTLRHITGLGEFLRTYVDRLPTYNIHTQGHPPGMVVIDYGLRAVGLGGQHWNGAVVLAGGAVGVMATLVTVREVASEAVARTVAPLLVLAPGAIWWSSADALFTGVGALSVTAVVLATGRSDRDSDRLAALGGIGFAVTAYLSYGLVLLAVVPAAVAFTRRRVRPLVVAAVTGLATMTVVSVTTGFLWWEGLVATRERYFAGVASVRPYRYWVVADLVVFGLMIGPAAVAALAARGRSRTFAALFVGGVAAVLLADLSGMAKAEIERIWLPFVPWVLVGGVAMLSSRRATRAWLGAQAVVALVVATTVRSPW